MSDEGVKLLGCPFCGSKRVHTYFTRDGRRAACECGASIVRFNGPNTMPSAEERVRTAWNTRQPVRVSREEVARIVDPEAFDEGGFPSRAPKALRKADAILALFSPSSSDGYGEGGGRPGVAITRAEARRIVNYAFMASNANWTPYIKENGVGQESPWVEFMGVAARLWSALFPDLPVWEGDPRLPHLPPDAAPQPEALTHPAEGRHAEGPPEPPWPPGAVDNANAKRAGWAAFFEGGRSRQKSGFPPAREDLHRAYREGWDAAALAHPETAGEG